MRGSAHGGDERELQRLRTWIRRAVPLPDGGAGRRFCFLLLAGLPRKIRARRDLRRRRVRRLQQALRARAGLASGACRQCAQVRLLGDLPRPGHRRGGRRAARTDERLLRPRCGSRGHHRAEVRVGSGRAADRSGDVARGLRDVAGSVAGPGPRHRFRRRRDRRQRACSQGPPWPAPSGDLQSQGRHRQDDHHGEHRRRPRRARAQGCCSSTPTRKGTWASPSASRSKSRSTTCSSWV